MLGRLAEAARAILAVAFRPRNEVPAQSQTAYQSAAQGRRAQGWFAPGSGPNAAVIGGLPMLRQRSRAATRNDGYAKGAVSRLVTNIVGTGIKPLSKTADVTLRAAVQDLWRRWTDEADADGLLDFYGLQALGVRSCLEAGEVFIRLRNRLPSDGLPVPLQLQLLEAELCAESYTTIAPTGNVVRAGIEFNGIGQRVAYWFFRAHPGDQLLQLSADAYARARVPAESVIHLYDPLRPGQIRGVPHLTQALTRLRDLDEFDDATLLKQKLSNLFVGFRKLPGVPGDPTIDPLTGQKVELDGAGRPLMPLEPGSWQDLYPGEEMDWSEPPEVGQTYESFMRQQLMAVAVAVEVPYEILTGDLSKINDRTARIILNEFRRGIQRWQAHVVTQQLCRRVWASWWDRAILAGALPVAASDYQARPQLYRAVDWTPQRWQYLNPVQDVQARVAEIRAGLTSRRDSVSELGDDIEQLDDEIAADNSRSDALGLVFDTDPRHVANDGKLNAAAPAGAPPGEGGEA